MFFCEKCRYSFGVTKDIKGKQIGGKINDSLNNIFSKYMENEPITEKDLKRITGKDLTDDDRFDEMTKKNQRKLISTIKAIDKNFFVEEEKTQEPKIGVNIAYFICKYCKNYKPIKPQTCIYTKIYGGENTIETANYTYTIYDQTLPRTRNYICKNSKCKSHTNDSVREAVLTKNALDQIVYVCTSCSTHWIGSQ